jgi:hypothetical protein
MSRLFLIGLALLLPFSSLQAQDKPLSGDKQKAFAAEAMKKAEVKDARVVESPHLVVATTLPEAKATALAQALDKVFVSAHKALKFELADVKSKTLVFTFAELDQYRQFKRSVIKERPDDDETASFDVRRDDPYIAVSARRGDKSPNFELLAGNEICRAVLAKKGGNARLSEWMKDGFARAVAWRNDPKSASADRAAVVRLAPRLPKGAKAANPAVEKAWMGTGREKDLIAASLMDYLTFGPGNEKFGSLVSSMIPTAGIDAPSFEDALRAIEWMVDDLDRSWREWVAKGSVAAK